MSLEQLIQTYWPLLAAVLVIAIVLVVWLIGRARKPQQRARRADVLDEGAAPAQRNQALIDAPPAAAMTPPLVTPPDAAGTFAGVGVAVARGAQEQVETARLEAAREMTPKPEAAPAPSSAPISTPPISMPESGTAAEPLPGQDGEPDDLRRIKGIGPKLVTMLHALGITRFAQVAAWSEADLDELDTKLGAFAGRPRRDSWVEQAQLLAQGDTGAYEAKFGKL